MERFPFKSLLNPDVYPEHTECVRLVQTHISYLFLTDSFVYKIKKPVNLGFLNFSTVDRRRFYCGEEVRLNRRLCPDMYLGVEEIRMSSSGPTFRGDGPVIDYAVKMKRLPASRMLDKMLAENRITPPDIREVARVIAEFHLRAERGPEISENGSSENIRRICEENFHQVEDLVHLANSEKKLKIIRHWVNTFLDENEPLFSERVRDGFIRDCDGDIHLENICMTSPVCIFDCIEFSSRFRYIDTAADIAFFLMDLDFHEKSQFSQTFLDEYVARTGDAGVDRLLDFYEVNRAVVRGKVELFKLLDPLIAEPEKGEALEKAQRYFRLASGFSVRVGRLPALIITCGLTGSGKSCISSRLASELGTGLLSSDSVRKELAGIPAARRCREEFGSGIYAPAFNEATYKALYERTEKVLQPGGSMVVDATFRRRSDRRLFADLAHRCKVPFYIIHTVCPEDIVKLRLDDRSHDPSAVSDGRWDLYALQKEEFEPPQAAEGNVIAQDTSGVPDDIIDNILLAMEFGDETQSKG